MRSSYIENNYGEIFENIAFAFIPHICVELGVLDGYSTLHIAKGMKKLARLSNHIGHIHSYDLWEDYLYKHGSLNEVNNMLRNNGVDEFVTLHKMDAYKVHNEYEDHTIDLLHVDISNDGKVLEYMLENWDNKLTFGGMMLFEGGSKERDEVEWMKKYNKKPINPVFDTNSIITKYLYATYYVFPSLTLLIKKL